MLDTMLPHGYTCRSPSREDAPAVAAVMAACQIAEGDPPQISAAELLDDWEGIDLAEDAIVLLDGRDQVVGSGDLMNRGYCRVSVYGYIHPDHCGRGLGACIAAWGRTWVQDRLHRAPQGMQVVVEHYIRGSNAAARRLMDAQGYFLARTVYVMSIDMAAEPPDPLWPPYIEARTFVPGQDEDALYRAGEESFLDSWSRPPGTYEGWVQPTQSSTFDPGLLLLPIDTRSGEIVGVCRAQVVDRRGWIATVGVRPAWRGRGIGLAMLQHTLRALRDRGVRCAELSVDAESPTGAPRLYSRAGMHVDKHYLIYRRELRPGRDFGTLPQEQ